MWLQGAHEFTVAFAVANIGDPIYILADGTALTGLRTPIRFSEAELDLGRPAPRLGERLGESGDPG